MYFLRSMCQQQLPATGVPVARQVNAYDTFNELSSSFDVSS